MEEAVEWDVEILEDLFDPGDGERILKTPISPSFEDDWYWKFELKGQYTVKSAYRTFVMQSNLGVNSDNNHWPFLWKLKIPKKMKIHWWRAAKGIILVCDVHRQRGVDLDATCLVCASQPETIKHLFLECSKTHEIWSNCELSGTKGIPDDINFTSILLFHDIATLAKIASLLWFVWRAKC